MMATRLKKHLVDGRYSIRDLVDLQKLHHIFQHFTDSMGFTIGFLSVPDMDILIASGWRDICTKFHRTCPLGAENCRKSNIRLARKMTRPGKVVIEKCANGLVDCAMPVFIQGKCVALLATGQVLLKAPDLERFRKQAKAFGCHEKKYLTALAKVPVVSRRRLKQVTGFLRDLASLIAELGYAGLKEKEKAEELVQDIAARKRAESELRKTAEQLQVLQDAVTDGVLVVDIQTRRIVKANASVCRMFGYAEKEFLRKKINELHPAAQFKEALRNFRSLVLGKKKIVPGERFEKKDGAVFFADITANRVMLEGRRCLVGSFRDVTDRKFADDRARETALRLAAVFNSAFQFIALLKPDGEVLEVNDSALSFGGLSSRDVRGKHFWDCFWWTISKQTRKNVRKAVARASRGKFVRYPVEVLGKKGATVTIDFSLVPIRDEKGRVVLLTAEGRDITDRVRAEEALSQRESYLSSMIENQPGMAWLKDREGRFLAVNRAFAEACGMKTPANVEGKTDRDVWPADLARRYREDDLRVMKSRGSYSTEEPILRGGVRRWCETFKTAVLDEHGSVLGTTGYSHDITVRKEESEALRKSEARFRSYFDLPLHGIAITSPEKGWLQVNSRLCSILGYSRKELLRKTWSEMTHPDDLAEDNKKFRRLLAGEILQYNMEKRFIRKDGEVIWTDLGVGAVRKSDGRVDYVCALVEDITERKRAEEALRASESRYRELISLAVDGILTVSREGIITDANEVVCDLTGMPRDALVGKHVRELPFDRTSLRKNPFRFDLLQKHKIVVRERTVLRPGGSIIDLETRTKMMPDGTYQSICCDITARKKAEESLRDNEARLRSLYSNMREGLALHEIIYGAAGRAVDYRILAVNKAYGEHTGLRVEKVTGKLASAVYGTEDPPFLEAYAAVARGGKPFSFDVYFSPLARHFHISVFSPKRGQFATVFTDITDRKRSEIRLRESEEQFRSLFESSPDALMTFEYPSCKFTSANAAMLRMFRVKNKTAIFSLSPWDLSPDRQPDGSSSAVQARKMIARAIRKGSHFFEWTHQRVGGETFLAEVLLTRVKNETGLFFQSTVRDITERNLAEVVLKESEERFRLVVNNSLDTVYRRNIQTGKYDFFSAAVRKMTGFSPKELIGKDIGFVTRRVHPDDLLATGDLLDRVKRGDLKSGTVEYRFRHKNGSYRWLSDRFSVLFDAEKRPLYWVGISRDVTDAKRAADELRLSEGRLQLQFRRMPVGCILWSPDFRVLSWNPAAERIFGYKAREALGKHPYELIVPSHVRSLVKPLWKRLLQGDQTANLINENRTKQGKMILCKWTNTPLWKSDGSILGVLSMAEDITKQRGAEKAVRLAHFSIDHASDAVYWIGSDGTFIYVNDAACRILGYSRKEILGMRIAEVDPGFPAFQWEAHWKALREKKSMLFETFHKTRTGVLVPVEVNANYFQFEGKEYNFAFARDITERKFAENALREHRRQLLQIIDAVPHMIFAKDKEGRFLIVNQAVGMMYGLEPKQLIGRRRRNLHPVPAEAKKYEELERQVLAMGRPLRLADEPFTDVLGRLHLLQTIRVPFKMAGLKEDAILGVSVDMTEQRKVEEFRNDIVRTVSHELRTPLSIEKEGISLLMDAVVGPVNGEQKEILGTVMRSIDRLSRMITSLLDISIIETGKIKLLEQRTDMVDLVKDTFFEFKKRASEKGLDLKVTLPEGPAEVFADPDKITQVLSNLVDNAVKFTAKGSVAISLTLLKDAVACEVRDTGIGIAPENIAKMFEKFQQFSRTAGPGEKGFGLGLSIAKGIVEMHKGRIWVESEWGQGTRMTFTLPALSGKGIS